MKLSTLFPRPSFLRSFDDWSHFDGIRFGLTGHRGTLGAILASRLQHVGANISTFDGDITDESCVASWVASSKPDIVFNLAAIVPLAKVNDDPAKAVRVNSIAPFFLAEALRRANNGPWFFHASTSHVYAARTAGDGIRLSETACCLPASLYGATKLAGEQVLAPLAAKTRARICVGRIFSFFHETQPDSFLIPGLVNRIANANSNEAIEVNDPGSTRDFLYACHVIDALLHLAVRRYTGVINIASGHGISVGAVAERLISLSAKPVQVRHLQDMTATSLIADTSRLEQLLARGLQQ